MEERELEDDDDELLELLELPELPELELLDDVFEEDLLEDEDEV